MAKEERSLTDEGVLIQWRAGRWDAWCQIDPKLFKDLPKKVVRGSKSLLVDRTILEEMAANRRICRSFITYNTVPFPIDGFNWIPKERITDVDSFLSMKREEYFELRDQLKRRMPLLKREYRRKYPQLYDESKYPTRARIDKQFYFWWRFVEISPPDPDKGLLSPKMYKEAEENFKQMKSEMEEMTVTLMANMIMGRIAKLNEQCGDERANQGTINAINRLMENWEGLWKGHVSNKSFKITMNRIKRIMKKTDADKIRSSEEFRSNIERETGKILRSLQSVATVNLPRKLDV